jgi:hypothetical protein
MQDNAVGIHSQNWFHQCIGGGTINITESSLLLILPDMSGTGYVDAEINDYGKKMPLLWSPPLCMKLRARTSHPFVRNNTPKDSITLLGTAGFGFWNAPFLLAKRIGSRLPESVWFFYASPPSRLCLVPDSPGWGWKAQVVHAHRPGFFASLFPTLATVAWARMSGHDKSAGKWVQKLSGAQEAILEADLTVWNEYSLEWTKEVATFSVNNKQICCMVNPPQGPLGFVAWIDNQFAVATPRGEFRSGVLKGSSQWLELADMSIVSSK